MVVSTDTTVESDAFRMAPAGVSVHFDRIALRDVTAESLAAMEAGVEASARLLADAQPDGVVFACTSASVVIGDQRIVERISRAAPGAYATTIITAVVNALRVLRATRVSLVTPYVEEINAREVDYLGARGIEVVAAAGMGITCDMDIARVSPEEIYRFVRRHDPPNSEAVFISCGNFRSSTVIEELERDLGKPVVTSNQATMWDLLAHTGVRAAVPGYGRLMDSLAREDSLHA